MKALAILFFLCLFLPAKGQVTGLVTDKEGKGIADAVVLWEDTLSHFQTPRFTYTNAEGKFLIHPEANHSNRITVSRLGYISQTIPLSVSHTSIAIILLKDTTFQLKEVTVKARRVPVKVKTDRLVYNMKANPMKDGNALESFRYIPFITANDKEISIIGKESTQIYINGHKCTLSGETLQAYLRSLPANDIESIEILHSPNATYRGEGNFGVINIILKNKKKNGMQGLANLTLTKKTHFSGFGDLALMIRKNKFSINIMGGGAHINNIQSTFSENQYRSNSSLTRIQDNVDGYDRNGWGTLQVDYHLSEQTYWEQVLPSDRKENSTARTEAQYFFQNHLQYPPIPPYHTISYWTEKAKKCRGTLTSAINSTLKECI